MDYQPRGHLAGDRRIQPLPTIASDISMPVRNLPIFGMTITAHKSNLSTFRCPPFSWS